MFNKFKETAEDNYIENIILSLKKLNINIDKFLDIGCYDGLITERVSRSLNPKQIWGFDVDEEKMLEANAKNIKTKKVDFENRNWNIDEKFDFIFNNQVIEHLYDIDNFMENIKKILSKDGYCLISTENLASWHNILALMMGYQAFSLANMSSVQWTIGNPYSRKEGHNNNFMKHRAVFTFYALKEFVKIHDFKIIKEICSGYFPLPNNLIGNTLAKIDTRHAMYIALLIQKN